MDSNVAGTTAVADDMPAPADLDDRATTMPAEAARTCAAKEKDLGGTVLGLRDGFDGEEKVVAHDGGYARLGLGDSLA